MKTFFGIAGTFLAVLVLSIALAWVVEGNNFFLYKAFAPQYAQVQRETFEQTKSFQQGSIEELQNMEFEYDQAPEVSKGALRKIILHKAADYPNQLPPDLDSFVKQLKREEASAR